MFLNLFVLLYPLGVISGTEFSPLYKLHKTILEGYDPDIRPIKDPRMATNVTVDFSMYSVEEVNEARESLTSFGGFNITWYDEWLVWNISDHAGIQKIYMPLHHVWTPDLVVINTVKDIRILSDSKGLVSVTNTGLVTWYRTMIQITKCSMDMRKFPIDKQTCILRLVQMISNSNDVVLQGGSVMSNYTIFQSQGEWREIEKNMKTITYVYEEGFSQNEISLTFTFQRKPLHFVITSVLPVLLLSVLNLGVFLLPPESGEKISLCISVFLSYALILTDINEVLPLSPDSLAIFNVYLLTMLFVKVITTLATVVIVERYHTEKREHKPSASSKESRDGNNSMLDESSFSTGRYFRKLSAKALNRVCFSVISFIMIAATSICLALLLL